MAVMTALARLGGYREALQILRHMWETSRYVKPELFLKSLRVCVFTELLGQQPLH